MLNKLQPSLDDFIKKCDSHNKKIFHGSDHIIDKPQYGLGNVKNDFGIGFYCTYNEELSKEWAAQSKLFPGYSNEYCLDISELKILDLTKPQYNLLNWLTLLLKFRDFVPVTYEAIENKKYMLDNFDIDLSNYDVLIGYRADDSYFSWAKDFLHNQIGLNQLQKAMQLGGLGNQIVLISPKSFEKIKFVDAVLVEKDYYYRRKNRSIKADKIYYSTISREKEENDLTASDIRKGGLKNEHFCISSDLQR